jgi:SAM-dependent methyltransferase
MIHNEDRFNQLIDDALAQGFSGWNFSYLDGRWSTEDIPWDYEGEVRQEMPHARTMLDMGTGGGEFLESLAPLPEKTYATEGWEVNVPIAQERLKSYGVKVFAVGDKHNSPFEENTFDLVINRHDALNGEDIYHILKPDGIFITQQVGGANNIRFNEYLDAPSPEFGNVLLENTVQQLTKSGFDIIHAEESFPEERYFDIGAVVFYLSVIQWQIEDFSTQKYQQQLGKIHNMIEQDGYVSTLAHRFFIKAQKKNT